jgi:hypothetical protein
MDHRVSVTYTRELLAHAALRACLRQMRWSVLFFYGVSVVITAILVTLGAQTWYVWIEVGIVIACTIAIVAAFVVPYRQTMSNFDRLDNKTSEFAFNANNWVAKSELGESTLAWSTIETLSRESRVWLIKLRGLGNAVITLPVAQMDEATREFLVDQVKRAGGRVD